MGCFANISFLHNCLASGRNLNGAASSNTFARIEGRNAVLGVTNF
jgi:hypothetical protein